MPRLGRILYTPLERERYDAALEIRKRIQWLMRDEGLTKEDVQARIGRALSPTGVDNVLRFDNPQFATIYVVATRGLECTLADLFLSVDPLTVEITESLERFAAENGLSLETTCRLARIPKPDKRPNTSSGWRKLFELVAGYLE